MPGITVSRARCASGYETVGVEATLHVIIFSKLFQRRRVLNAIHASRTGVVVSRWCLGTMNFGPETSETDSFSIMDRALEHGINFFDTANVYGAKKGEGVTEQIHGRWFAQAGGRRDKVILTCVRDSHDARDAGEA